MEKARRICIYGGPGTGKSVLAAQIFSSLKIAGVKVELVTEYIKTWAYEGKFPKSFDQVYVFAKQLKREDAILRHVDVVVTDSPLLLAGVYSKYYGFVGHQEITALAMRFQEQFPSVDILLPPSAHDYKPEGRYQTLEQAYEVDNMIRAAIAPLKNCYGYDHRRNSYDDLVQYIQSKL